MKTASLNENWNNLGTNSSTGGYAGIGRIDCVAFHPTDVNAFLLFGSVVHLVEYGETQMVIVCGH